MAGTPELRAQIEDLLKLIHDGREKGKALPPSYGDFVRLKRQNDVLVTELCKPHTPREREIVERKKRGISCPRQSPGCTW